MLNPLVTLLSGNVSHPYQGGRRTKTVTKKHVPLMWECMLGAVYAKDPTKLSSVDYFDYDYAAARAFAKLSECTDLRIYRATYPYRMWEGDGFSKGKLVLWGIPPKKD